jgi:pantoate kinase
MFDVVRAPDGSIKGTTGIGFGIEEGVRVRMSAIQEECGSISVTSNGVPAKVPALSWLMSNAYADVWQAYDIALEVSTALPIGAGYGVSGATALGASLCVSALSKAQPCPLVHAYDADASTGGGYGDIVTQIAGGIALRITPGIDGKVEQVPPRDYLVVSATFGPLSTKAVLADARRLKQISEAATACMGGIAPTSGIQEIMAGCNEFARGTGLMTPRLAEAVDAVSAAHDVPASMVMLGESMFTLAKPGNVASLRDILSSFEVEVLVTRLAGG